MNSSVIRCPFSNCSFVASSRSEANCENDSSSLNCASANLTPPPNFLIIFVCAAPPTLDTEIPTLIAGLIPELKRSVSRNICPSVIEITLVGMKAETSLA